jgi:hypothetical protein
MTTSRFTALLPIFICVTPTPGCVSAGHVGGVPQQSVSMDPELALFLAAVEFLPTLTEELELRVDPRAFAPDAGILSLQLSDLTGTATGTAARTRILADTGTPTVDITDLSVCSGAGPGVRPPEGYSRWPDQGPHSCAILSLSRPGGVHFPPDGIDERERFGSGDHRSIRVFLISPGRYSTADLVLRRDGDGWVVVTHRMLREVVS